MSRCLDIDRTSGAIRPIFNVLVSCCKLIVICIFDRGHPVVRLFQRGDQLRKFDL